MYASFPAAIVCIVCSVLQTRLATDVVCRLWAGIVSVLFSSKEFEVQGVVCAPNHVNIFKCLQLVTDSSTTAQVIKCPRYSLWWL